LLTATAQVKHDELQLTQVELIYTLTLAGHDVKHDVPYRTYGLTQVIQMDLAVH
jgi:hypothetical protein